MCEGKIIVSASDSRNVRFENNEGVFGIIKGIFRNVTNFFATNQTVVNFCGNCGDLEIEGEEGWLKTPLPYRFSIGDAISNGGIKVNGRKTLCNSCSSMGVKEFREKSKTPLQ